MLTRIVKFNNKPRNSFFLWGPRQCGKSTLLKSVYPENIFYDLLLSSEYERIVGNISILKEELMVLDEIPQPVIVDEIQKIPALMDEIHWLIENKKIQFILSGSSPQKIIRSGGNLLGGRLIRKELFPLVFPEIPAFDLLQALNRGLIPKHYLEENFKELISSYTGDYLKEEIAGEARLRNVGSFRRFLEIAAFSNGEIVNLSNISRECGEKLRTVKEYFQILEDTLIGVMLNSFIFKPKRRVILAPKFYFFDLGIVNFLLNRPEIKFPGELFGRAFEHFIFQELRAHTVYTGLNYPISYWRTASGVEVDFILGRNQVAIEIKSTQNVNTNHLSGMRSFLEEYKVKKAILVSMDPKPRQINNITVLPWKIFLEKLWSGEIIG